MFISFLKNLFCQESYNPIDGLKKRLAQGLELLEDLGELKKNLENSYAKTLEQNRIKYENRKEELKKSEECIYGILEPLERIIKEFENMNKDK
jgi:hypothetical protein